MYGTIARMRVQAGKEAELGRVMQDRSREIPGFLFAHVYRMDEDPQTLMLVVAFRDREAYHANARSPEQDAEYQHYRALLEADPEWHDGEIIFSDVAASVAAERPEVRP